MRTSACPTPPTPRRGAVLPLVFLALAACRDGSPSPAVLRTAWVAPQPSRAFAQPVVVGDLVIAGAGGDRVVARRRVDGAVRWSVALGQDVGGRRLVAAGTLVLVPLVTETVALDAATGAVRWRRVSPPDTVDGWQSPGQVLETEAAADARTAYLPAWGASVSAVTLATGVPTWVWRPGTAPTDTASHGVFRSGAEGVAVSGDTVYVAAWHYLTDLGGTAEAWFVALDAETGTELWRHAPGAVGQAVAVLGAPAVGGRLAIFTARGGAVWAIDRFTGQLAWKRDFGGIYSTDASAVVAGDQVLVAIGDGPTIASLRLADGALQWRSGTRVSVRPPIVAGERYIFLTSGPSLLVLDRTTGRKVQELRQPGVGSWESYVTTGPALAGAELFVGVDAGTWKLQAR